MTYTSQHFTCAAMEHVNPATHFVPCFLARIVGIVKGDQVAGSAKSVPTQYRFDHEVVGTANPVTRGFDGPLG